MEKSINGYLDKYLSLQSEWVIEMEIYAKEHNVPIMDPVSIDFMQQLIRVKQPEKILEVGTAIGYSALRMLEANPQAEIITIERDEKRYKEAVDFIEKCNKSNQITVILGDAIDVLEELSNKKETFDFVFIDAAKGKYQSFFDLVHPMIDFGGLLITDNVLFRGYVADIDSAPKRFKNMVKRIRKYNDMLISHPSYVTSILPIGDGVMVSHKK